MNQPKQREIYFAKGSVAALRCCAFKTASEGAIHTAAAITAKPERNFMAIFVPPHGKTRTVAYKRAKYIRVPAKIQLINRLSPGREFQYQVEWTAIVPPTAVRVIEPTSEPALTLVKCFPFYCAGAAPDRFIVRARKVVAEPRAPSAP